MIDPKDVKKLSYLLSLKGETRLLMRLCEHLKEAAAAAIHERTLFSKGDDAVDHLHNDVGVFAGKLNILLTRLDSESEALAVNLIGKPYTVKDTGGGNGQFVVNGPGGFQAGAFPSLRAASDYADGLNERAKSPSRFE